MKKFLSLLLAAMMLCSGAVAMATEEGTETSEYTSTIDIRETDDRWTTTEANELSTPKTEFWLQVDGSSGQIDVTVPLVLVFKTNIDGGSATSPDSYKITNNSSADLVVTKLATTKEAKSNENPLVAASQPMTMVAYGDGSAPAEDQYKAQLRVDTDSVALGSSDTAKTNNWDLNTTSHQASAVTGGLFELKKATADGTGTDTRVYVDMTTGELSFVTEHKADGTVDTDKGVHLMTLNYTVAIDTSDGIGETITTNDDPTVNGTQVVEEEGEGEGEGQQP